MCEASRSTNTSYSTASCVCGVVLTIVQNGIPNGGGGVATRSAARAIGTEADADVIAVLVHGSAVVGDELQHWVGDVCNVSFLCLCDLL